MPCHQVRKCRRGATIRHVNHVMRKSYLDAQHFRARANECRTKAELLYDARARESMLKLAANYERIPDKLEELSSTASDVASLLLRNQADFGDYDALSASAARRRCYTQHDRQR